MIIFGKANFGDLFDLHVMEAASLRFESEVFDTVVCNDLLQYMSPEDISGGSRDLDHACASSASPAHGVFAEFFRVLRVGGTLFVTALCKLEPDDSHQTEPVSRCVQSPQPPTLLTESLIRSLLAAAGFLVLSVQQEISPESQKAPSPAVVRVEYPQAAGSTISCSELTVVLRVSARKSPESAEPAIDVRGISNQEFDAALAGFEDIDG
jgi:SAM-dependent methyltransferase